MTDDARSKPLLITREDELAEVAHRLARSPRVAFDLESNGMHAYRATACIIQLACDGEVIVVDSLATSLAPLGELLSSPHTEKIVHDVAFDARILAEAGVRLANARDTSIAARMLTRPATGLAALLESELGVHIDKKMQQHDWAERPLTAAMVTYLAGDVLHLSALADRLFGEVVERGIADEVEEETRYRLGQAIGAANAVDPRPPYVRLKGIDRVPPDELPILRHLANIRERLSAELDVPPYKVLGPDVLFAIAKAKPASLDELARIRGATGGRRARSIANDLLDAVTVGIEDGTIPDEDRVWFEKPRIPGTVVRARRAREQRLTKWRKDEAKRRGVDEQVVLPGHCLQGLADLEEPTLQAIADVPGIGAFRAERDGAALVAVLLAPPAAAAEPIP
ncbi:MAG TPA: HRDC domain-containing protein [Labilithrix sp.]|nr:HRDC domain-containing protein [Labilithrix sp.]